MHPAPSTCRCPIEATARSAGPAALGVVNLNGTSNGNDRRRCATGWGDAFQHGIRKVISSDGKTNPFLERVLQANPLEIEAVVAPIFAKRLSESEARAMADFYETSTGRRIIEQQSASTSDPDPPIRLTVEQRQEYDRFAGGVGGRAAQRILSDTGLRNEYLDEIGKRFGR